MRKEIKLTVGKEQSGNTRGGKLSTVRQVDKFTRLRVVEYRKKKENKRGKKKAKKKPENKALSENIAAERQEQIDIERQTDREIRQKMR